MAFQTTLRHFRANTSRLLPNYNHSSSTRISSKPHIVLASTNATASTQPTVIARPYSHPLIYDIAFSFRDFDSESRFLLDAFSHYTSSVSLPLTSTLEIGCGPARHTAALLQQHPQLTQCYALDNSPDMLAYAQKQFANTNKAINVSFIQADMVAPQGILSSNLPAESVQLATILLGTLGHCLDNASAQRCFQNIAAALQPGGLIIIELPHPMDLFSGTYYFADTNDTPNNNNNNREQLGGQVRGDFVGEEEEEDVEDVVDLDDEEEDDDIGYVKCWEIENPDNPEELVYVEWGREGDDFDVDRQVLHRTVGLSMYRGEELVSSEVEVVPQRCFTLQEIDLLGRGAGLEVCGVYGELSMEVVGLVSEGAHRMVVCLKKGGGEKVSGM